MSCIWSSCKARLRITVLDFKDEHVPRHSIMSLTGRNSRRKQEEKQPIVEFKFSHMHPTMSKPVEDYSNVTAFRYLFSRFTSRLKSPFSIEPCACKNNKIAMQRSLVARTFDNAATPRTRQTRHFVLNLKHAYEHLLKGMRAEANLQVNILCIC